jgi:hypothetical protein
LSKRHSRSLPRDSKTSGATDESKSKRVSAIAKRQKLSAPRARFSLGW